MPTLSLGILRDFKNIAVTLSDEGSVTEEIVGAFLAFHSPCGACRLQSLHLTTCPCSRLAPPGRVVGLHQRRLRNKYGPPLLQSGIPDVPPPEPLRPEVRLSAEELRRGHSRNYADDRNYRDPGRNTSPERDVPSEQQLLDDWVRPSIVRGREAQQR